MLQDKKGSERNGIRKSPCLTSEIKSRFSDSQHHHERKYFLLVTVGFKKKLNCVTTYR